MIWSLQTKLIPAIRNFSKYTETHFGEGGGDFGKCAEWLVLILTWCVHINVNFIIMHPHACEGDMHYSICASVVGADTQSITLLERLTMNIQVTAALEYYKLIIAESEYFKVCVIKCTWPS